MDAVERIERIIEKNSTDIHATAVQVAELTVMMKNSELRHMDDVSKINAALEGIGKLNDKMAHTISLEKDIAAADRAVVELKSELRITRHDMVNMQQNLAFIPLQQKALGEMNVEINSLKVLRDRVGGGAAVATAGAKMFWAVFGGGITILGVYILSSYFTHQEAVKAVVG